MPITGNNNLVRWLLPGVGLVALAMVAVSYSAVKVGDQRMDVLRMLTGLISTLGVAGAVGVAAARGRSNEKPAIIGLVIVSVVALMPLAVDSLGDLDRMDVSLLAVAVAVAIHMANRKGVGSRLLTAIANTVACAMSPAALAWSLAVMWGTEQGRHLSTALRSDMAVMLSAVVGGTLGCSSGWWRPNNGAVGAAGDMIVLLPVVAAGLAGVGGRLPFRWRGLPGQPEWLARWCGLSCAGLLLVTCGLPLDYRVLMLPFWFTMPWGLECVWRLLQSARGGGVGVIMGIFLVLLSLPGVFRLLDAFLLLIFIINLSL